MHTLDKPIEIGSRHPEYKTCPICGHAGWCCTTGYGKYIICKRDTQKSNVNGFKYIGDSGREQNSKFVREGNWDGSSNYVEVVKKDTSIIRFPDGKLDMINRRLLSMLCLEDFHKKKLNEGGISDEAIAHYGIKSYPEPDFLRKQSGAYSKNPMRWKLAQELSKEFGDLTGFPGAYVKEGKDSNYWNLSSCGGIMFPITNVYNEIVMMQIRVDNPPPGFKGKYMMFSSDGDNKPNGCTPSSRAGLVKPRVMGDTYVCYITEGIKKAIVIAEKLGSLAITIQGVNSWAELIEQNSRGERFLDVLRNRYGVGMFIIALDNDKYQNKKVMSQQKNIIKTMYDEGFQVGLAEWDSYSGKGIDDCLNNGYKVMHHMVPRNYFEKEKI